MKLNKKNDLLVIIDMINGFTYEGVFASENTQNILDDAQIFVKECLDNGVETIHYTDYHPETAQEFNSYPVHCLQGSNESLPVKEVDDSRIDIIKKNSTNGFFAKNPFDYKKNIYIIGFVTDICIFEFALTAQKYKEEFNIPYTVNVIEPLVATFDAPNHKASEIQTQFISILEHRGVNISR